MTYRHVVTIHADFVALEPAPSSRSVNFVAATEGDQDAVELSRWFEDQLRRSFTVDAGVHDPLPDVAPPKRLVPVIVDEKTGGIEVVEPEAGAVITLTKGQHLKWIEA